MEKLWPPAGEVIGNDIAQGGSFRTWEKCNDCVIIIRLEFLKLTNQQGILQYISVNQVRMISAKGFKIGFEGKLHGYLKIGRNYGKKVH